MSAIIISPITELPPTEHCEHFDIKRHFRYQRVRIEPGQLRREGRLRQHAGQLRVHVQAGIRGAGQLVHGRRRVRERADQL